MIDQARSNLLQEPNSFVGRERELDELRRFVHGVRATTLCGSGGIGKTRLALRVLAGLKSEFPDGVWFIELGDLRQPELVVSRVASVIGVDEEPGRPMLDTLADALRPRSLLLALDNCEHLIEACANLCHRLLASSPGLRVVATSREPLRVAAESVWLVPPLALPPSADAVAVNVGSADDVGSYDAIRLFAERAAAAMPGFSLVPANLAATAAICRALDGVPLAIELAAAWVRVLSVEQIAARLADRFRLLTTGDRMAPPRQRTLRAAIDWSHDLLSASEQALLRRLSVFAGWSLDMSEQVCADDKVDAAEILDLTASLVGKSLIEVEPEALGQTRYRMLDTIREYAAARLDAAGETEMMRRRFRGYTLRASEEELAIGMAQVPAPWSASVDVFRRYDVDAGNVREVLAGCLADRDAEAGLRICTAVRPCWIVRGTFAEGADWLDSLLALDAPGVQAAVRGAALTGRAQLALAGDPERAEEYATVGLELSRAAGDRYWEAGALNLLAEAALHAGRADQAAARADEALVVAGTAGDAWNEGYALGTRAAAAAHLGSLREARELGEAALAVMQAIDQQWGCARTRLGLGDLARLRGDHGEARRHYTEALPVLREVSARPEIARCLAGLGRIAMEQGELALARDQLAESLRLSHESGSRIGIARGLRAFAALAAREGRPAEALQLAAAVNALYAAAGLPPLAVEQTQRYLDAAASLGEPEVGRLRASGSCLTSSDAVKLALGATADNAAGRHLPGATADIAAGRDLPGATADSAAARHLPGATGQDLSALPQCGLTPREHEVVVLIAAGRSNKEIAEELFISPATAARHVANIFAKLGYTSRSQVAAWVTERNDAD
jgi:predicted ATPase/DNA-binding CsgD family transcriptional regulator